jgi:annexin A7/11
MAAGDASRDVDALRKAMKGFGTDETALIQILSKADPLYMALIRDTYSKRLGRNLERDVESEVSGNVEKGLLALIRGPLMQDVYALNAAVQGMGTNESLLNDVLIGRSNADMNAIKHAYQQKFYSPLESDVRGDLSMGTERLFVMILAATRAEESTPINQQAIDKDVRDLYDAMSGMGTDNMVVCSIFASRSDAQLRAINQTYSSKHHASLDKALLKEFSGHMRDVLLAMLRGAVDRASRDAALLDECMRGAGTKDTLLIERVIRLHWNRPHMEQVKRAYRNLYGKELRARVAEETSGYYEKMLLAILQ